MKKKPTTNDSRTDLKHDTMEFSATTDGDDIMDTDDASYEEEGISADELEALKEEDSASEAAALHAETADFAIDEDNLPEEDWTDDLADEGASEEDDDHHRK